MKNEIAKKDEEMKKNGIDSAKVKLRVVKHFPSLESVLKKAPIENTGSGIGHTNGTKISLNASRLSGESEQEQAAVTAHEAMHIERDDMSKGSGKNHKLWNIASDAVINAEIAAGGLATKLGAVKIPNAKELGAQKIYDILAKINKYVKEDMESDNKEKDNKAKGIVTFTQEEATAAIFGNAGAWQKGLDYIKYKDKQKEQKKLGKVHSPDFQKKQKKSNIKPIFGNNPNTKQGPEKVA
jgi:predicted metal-dependent peptidase